MSRHNKIANKNKPQLAIFKEEIAKLADSDLMSRSALVAQDLFNKKINRKYAVAQLSSIASEVNRRANPVKPFDKIKLPKIPTPVQEPTQPELKQQEEAIVSAI